MRTPKPLEAWDTAVTAYLTNRRALGRRFDKEEYTLELPTLQICAVPDAGCTVCLWEARKRNSTYHRSPRSAKDMAASPPTMKWSSTLMSTSCRACFSACVSSSSARLGSARPDG